MPISIPRSFLFQMNGDNDIGYFLKPIILHGFSASCHLGLFLVLSLVWLCSSSNVGDSKERLKNNRFLYYKTTLFTCLGLGSFYLLLSIYYYFCYFRNLWSDDNIATQLDLAIRAISWFAVSSYLGFVFNHLRAKKFPAFLRIWWGLFLLMSCSFLVIDFVWYRKLGIVKTLLWVLDFGSLLSSLVLNYAGFLGKRSEERGALLQEPLLNGSNVDGSCNSSGTGNVSLFENAGFLSMLTFSWMGPLLSVGHKKTLDLKDVPQLAHSDSVNAVFPIFKNKLESYTSCSNRSNHESSNSGITTFELAKSLVFVEFGPTPSHVYNPR